MRTKNCFSEWRLSYPAFLNLFIHLVYLNILCLIPGLFIVYISFMYSQRIKVCSVFLPALEFTVIPSSCLHPVFSSLPYNGHLCVSIFPLQFSQLLNVHYFSFSLSCLLWFSLAELCSPQLSLFCLLYYLPSAKINTSLSDRLHFPYQL